VTMNAMNALPSPLLLTRCRAGDPAALEEFARSYRFAIEKQGWKPGSKNQDRSGGTWRKGSQLLYLREMPRGAYRFDPRRTVGPLREIEMPSGVKTRVELRVFCSINNCREARSGNVPGRFQLVYLQRADGCRASAREDFQAAVIFGIHDHQRKVDFTLVGEDFQRSAVNKHL
jgi:hypothetical protein